MERVRCRLAVSALALALVAPLGAGPAAEDELELQASRAGFRPPALKLRKGETVRVALRTADGEHCFAVDALRIEKRIQPGRATLVELTPEQAGPLAFYCCLHADDEHERGRLDVTE